MIGTEKQEVLIKKKQPTNHTNTEKQGNCLQDNVVYYDFSTRR